MFSVVFSSTKISHSLVNSSLLTVAFAVTVALPLERPVTVIFSLLLDVVLLRLTTVSFETSQVTSLPSSVDADNSNVSLMNNSFDVIDR